MVWNQKQLRIVNEQTEILKKQDFERRLFFWFGKTNLLEISPSWISARLIA